jgi:hypothetical protein
VDFMITETETGIVEKDKADANIAT